MKDLATLTFLETVSKEFQIDQLQNIYISLFHHLFVAAKNHD